MFRLIVPWLTLLITTGAHVANGGPLVRVAADTHRLNLSRCDEPIFGDYYLNPNLLKQDFIGTVARLRDFFNARDRVTTLLRAASVTEQVRLRSEHRELMFKKNGIDSDDHDPDSKWAMQLFQNVAGQALARNESMEKLSKWDNKNFVEIAYENIRGRLYITKVRVHREKDALGTRKFASIR